MVYPGSGDKTLRVNLISIVNGAVDRIGDLETTVSSLNDTYVAKTDYNTFVSSTNSSLSTINTTLENCAKTNTTNTFTKAITFNSTTNTKGDATFGTNIIKSTTASDPSTATLTHVLNKGENDKLYAPITLSDTVSSLETDITTVSTVIADHQTDTTLHVSSSEKEGLTSLIANKDNFANKTEDTTFAKSVTIAGGATFGSTITKSNNTSSPVATTVLNKGESDALYAPKSHVSDTNIHTSAADKEALTELANAAPQFAKKTEANTFTETNTFSKAVTAQNGITASGGDIVISNGTLTFEDLIDGTIVERSGASGYQYIEGMPTSFENGVCYDIGEISNTTNLSNVKFTAEGRLVQTCELWFTTPATPPTSHQWPIGIYWIDSATGAAPTLIASKNYRLVFRQEPNKIIASIAYLY